jgi:hypothetical protein
MTSTARVGFVSAMCLFVVGCIYMIVVAFGVRQVGLSKPILDPTLAVMEFLTVVSALLFLVLMVVIYESTSAERKVFGGMALTFAVLMTGLTCAVHFVSLTSGRQSGFFVLQWPSTLYAVELLAWDFFLGLSLMSATFVFRGSQHHTAIQWALGISGALALIGVVGPITGNMPLQRIGIVGYGIGLPIAALMLALFFRRFENS